MPTKRFRLFVTRYRRSNAHRAFVRLAGWVLDCRRHGNTLDNLSAAGCEYVADWGANDDQPYLMTLDDGKTLVSVPYSIERAKSPGASYTLRFIPILSGSLIGSTHWTRRWHMSAAIRGSGLRPGVRLRAITERKFSGK